MHNLQTELEETSLSAEIFDRGLRPIVNEHVIEPLADIKLPAAIKYYLVDQKLQNLKFPDLVQVLKDYANDLWSSEAALLEKIIISKGLLTAYATTRALKMVLVYGPDCYIYQQQYQNSGKVVLALGSDQLLSMAIDLGMKHLGLKDSLLLPLTVISGLADLGYERTIASSDHIRQQLASTSHEASRQAISHFNSGQYGSGLSHLVQTASLQVEIEAMDRGQLTLLLIALPYKALNGLREFFVDQTYRFITMSKTWLSQQICYGTYDSTVPKAFSETSPFDLITTTRQPYLITVNTTQGKNTSIDLPIPIYSISRQSSATSPTADLQSDLLDTVIAIPKKTKQSVFFPTEQKIGAAKFFSPAFVKPLQWVDDHSISVPSANTTQPPPLVLPPQIVAEILHYLFVQDIERLINRPPGFKMSGDYKPSFLTTTMSDFEGISVSKSGINYRTDMNSDSDFYFTTDWLSIARMAVLIVARIKEYFLPPEEKVHLTLSRQAYAYVGQPNDTAKAALIATIHNFYKLNPDQHEQVKLALFAIETNRLSHLQMLFDKKRGGPWVAELKKYYHEGFIEQTSPINFYDNSTKSFTSELPNLSKLAACFSLESETHYWLAQDKRNRKQFDAALESIDQAIELIPWDKTETQLQKRTCERLKHAILLEKAEQNPNAVAELQKFHRDWQRQYPEDKSLRQIELQDSLHLQKPEIALPLLREICEESSTNSDAFYQRGRCEEQLSLKTEAIVSYNKAIEKAATHNDLTAYLSRKRLIACLEQDQPVEALRLYREISNHPCTLDDFYDLAGAEIKAGNKTESIEAFRAYIELCKSLSENELEAAAPKLSHALLQVADGYAENFPINAIEYYFKYLDINPNEPTAFEKCEKVCLRQKDWKNLQRLYERNQTDPVYVQKLETLTHFLYWDGLLNKMDGASTLVQSIAQLILRDMEEQPDSKLNPSKALAASLSLSTTVMQKLLIPYQRSRLQPKVDNQKLQANHYLSIIYNSFMISVAVFHYFQIINPDLAIQDWVKQLNIGLHRLEGIFLVIEGAINYPLMRQQCADILQLSSQLCRFFKTGIFTAPMSQTVLAGQAGIETSMALAASEAVKAGTDGLAISTEAAWQKGLDVYGNYALALVASASLVWRFAEFLFRDQYGIREERSYHMIKNLLIYSNLTFSTAGALGLTAAGGIAAVKTGVVIAGAGAAKLGALVAAGGAKAAVGLLGGGAVVVVAFGGIYYIYQGFKWIDKCTTEYDQRTAIEHNAGLLAQQGEFALAAEKLRQIAQPTIRITQNLQFYTCHHQFKAGNYAQVIAITNQQLAKSEQLDPQIKLAYRQLRLFSLANAASALLELIDKQSTSEIKPLATPTDSKSQMPGLVDMVWQDYVQLQQEITDIKQLAAQADSMFSILSKASQQAIKKGELTHVLNHYDRMITLKPDWIELNTQRRYYEYQLHYQDPKEHSTLLAKCKNVLLTTTADPLALRFSGLVYIHQQDLTNAELHFSKLVMAKSEDVEAMMYLTDIARSKQDYCSAQRWANQAFLQAQNAYTTYMQDMKSVTTETQYQEQKDHLAQQLAVTKKQVETVKNEIFAIWCSAAGKSMGEVTYHLLGDMIHLGISKINHRKPAAYDNLILPFWEKAGKQSQTVRPPMISTGVTSALRYF